MELERFGARTQEERDLLERQEAEERFFTEFVRPRIADAKEIYSSVTTAIWLGNGSGAIASLGFIGATWSNAGFYRPALWPFACFLAGTVFMGLGSVATLLLESAAIHRMIEARSILEMNMRDYKSPTQRAGLAFSEMRTAMAVISSICFVLGAIVGFALLLCRNTSVLS